MKLLLVMSILIITTSSLFGQSNKSYFAVKEDSITRSFDKMIATGYKALLKDPVFTNYRGVFEIADVRTQISSLKSLIKFKDSSFVIRSLKKLSDIKKSEIDYIEYMLEKNQGGDLSMILSYKRSKCSDYSRIIDAITELENLPIFIEKQHERLSLDN